MRACPPVDAIVDVMEVKGHAVFRNARGHDLNLVGIRSADTRSNAFNDWLAVFYTFPAGRWNSFAFPATTDPGLHHRLHRPERGEGPEGVAILKPGQYRSAWRLGRHRGRYKALVQQRPVTVYRDPDGDDELDMQEDRLDTGLFGINIHRANETRPSVRVDRWSAGCQVVQDPDHFRFLLGLCDRQVEKGIGSAFSYTLLEERDFS